MSAPETQGSVANDTETAADLNVPVNISKPNWQCPHCLTKFYEDHDRAAECAALGPGPDVESGIPVLSLTPSRGGFGGTQSVFGLTEVGPVTRTRGDNDEIAHVRTVLVGTTEMRPKTLASAGKANDGLLILADRVVREPYDSRELGQFDAISKVFLGDHRYGRPYTSDVTAWVEEGYSSHDKSTGWWRAPADDERELLNVITAGLLDKIVEKDEAELITRVRTMYAPIHSSHRTTQLPEDLASPQAGLMLAKAHGAPNHIWAVRWLAVHLEAVVTWNVKALQAWAAGDDSHGPLPMAHHLRVADLPKNPGKKRLTVMEPFGETYQTARDAVTRALLIDAPVNPIPDVADVETTVRTQEGN